MFLLNAYINAGHSPFGPCPIFNGSDAKVNYQVTMKYIIVTMKYIIVTMKYIIVTMKDIIVTMKDIIENPSLLVQTHHCWVCCGLSLSYIHRAG